MIKIMKKVFYKISKVRDRILNSVCSFAMKHLYFIFPLIISRLFILNFNSSLKVISIAISYLIIIRSRMIIVRFTLVCYRATMVFRLAAIWNERA